MATPFKVGDHVSWNYAGNRVAGRIVKVHTDDFDFKGQTHRATPDEPQYEVRSDETGQTAAHNAPALRDES